MRPSLRSCPQILNTLHKFTHGICVVRSTSRVWKWMTEIFVYIPFHKKIIDYFMWIMHYVGWYKNFSVPVNQIIMFIINIFINSIQSGTSKTGRNDSKLDMRCFFDPLQLFIIPH